MIRTAITALAVAAVLAACGTTADPNLADESGKPSAGKAKKDGTHAVVYTVGGTAKKGTITYATPSGQSQEGDAKLPWKKALKAGDGDALGVNAQNAGSGTITCSITVDGKKVKESKSSGQFAVVSCDALIGF